MTNVALFLVILRMMTAKMAGELGHRVVAEAGTIQAAKPLARTAEFDLGGPSTSTSAEATQRIAEIIAARGLPFIFVSGYGAAGRPVSFPSALVLRKPFLISNLAAMIENALDDRPARLIDEVMLVSNDEAIQTARGLAVADGIPAGISSGAALACALRLAKRPEMKARTVVTVLPDSAERYVSTPLFEGYSEP